MNYLGKRKLYDFLAEHGYKVPNIKQCVYERSRGTEFLYVSEDSSCDIKGLDLWVFPESQNKVSVERYEFNDDGIKILIDYNVYVDGEIYYQRIYR